MRRALLALLALPASALAQTITADVTTINLAQCNGATNEIRGSDDPLTVGLTWTVDVGTGTFASGGKFQLWAANRTPGTSQDGVTPCADPAVPGTGYLANKVVGGLVDAPNQSTSIKQFFSLREIATAAGYGCTPGASTTVYLCIQWLSSGSTVSGWASGASLSLDLTSPANAPSNVDPKGGDGVLHVSCSGNDPDSTSFRAKATLGGGIPHWSDQGSSCSGLTISGLTNGETYSVVVYGLNDANNPSPPSSPVSGFPVPTDDFYDHYRNDGGREKGGCSTAGGAAGLLSVLGLLAVRRRKP